MKNLRSWNNKITKKQKNGVVVRSESRKKSVPEMVDFSYLDFEMDGKGKT